MDVFTTPVLGTWLTFYAMTGASAATLTGLMFVVVTLVARDERLEGRHDGFSTFSTPTVVHFGAVLLISAVLLAPWPTFAGPLLLVGLGGLAGIIHMSRVMWRTKRLSSYAADADDWIWYVVVPLGAYVALLVGAFVMAVAPSAAMFVIGGAVVVLIFTGIRNSWDVVTYITVGSNRT